MNISTGIGVDMVILVISDIGKICAGKPIYIYIFELDVHLVLLSMTTPVCHTLKLQCGTNSKYVLIMRSTVFVTFVVKEYLGDVISLFSKG